VNICYTFLRYSTIRANSSKNNQEQNKKTTIISNKVKPKKFLEIF